MWKKYSYKENNLSLSFLRGTLSVFDFLKKEYDFRCIRKEIEFIRYESKKGIFVEVYFNKNTGELEIVFSRKVSFRESDWRFSLYDLIHLSDSKISTGFPMFTVHSSKEMKESLELLAELVKKYGGDLLKGNFQIFHSLQKRRKIESEKVTKEMMSSDTKSKAEIAWHKRDYKKVVELLEPVKKDLTSVELKKLEYAKKQSQSEEVGLNLESRK